MDIQLYLNLNNIYHTQEGKVLINHIRSKLIDSISDKADISYLAGIKYVLTLLEEAPEKVRKYDKAKIKDQKA